MEESQENKPDIQENAGRNPDGTFKPGFSGNPKGRPIKNPLKDYSLAEFASWTDEQKRAFLNQISPIDRWKMTEGNPKQDVDAQVETISKIISVDE